MCILCNERDAADTMFFVIISAVHVSGGFSAHHQKLIKLYVQSWVLSCFVAVYRWCGWGGTIHLKLNSYTPGTLAVDSRKAWQCPRLHIQFGSSWWWTEKSPETCRALIIIIKNIVSVASPWLYKIRACVCVLVWKRERERESGRGREGHTHTHESVHW
jgi:hypothetical protein